MLADPATNVSVLAGDKLLVTENASGTGGPSAALLSPSDLPQALVAAALPLFLGQDDDGRPHLALALPADAPDADALAGGLLRFAALREIGALLDDEGAGIFTTALALANWHAVHGHCARCGAPTDVVQAGWARSCPHCGAEHYPRTDPAVIMAVVDGEGRILLGRQASWPEKRYSTLAGFVEPGSRWRPRCAARSPRSPACVVGDVAYRGSQPWPFPSSLMLGFRARAVSTGAQADGVELAHVRWWSREEFTADIASRELMLPPRVSIARRLIEDWYGGAIEDAADWARP